MGKITALQNRFNQIQTGLMNYDIEYGAYPTATNCASLMKMLTTADGKENRHSIAFISLKSSDLDEQGGLLDPWGTPIEMSVTAEGVFHFRSAGPDKIWGTADDFVNNTNLPALR